MPRGCQPAFHSERAASGTDSAKRKFFPRPSAICPIRCHAQCFAWRAKARCGGYADLAGLPPRHNHGRLTRNRDDGADVPVLPVTMGQDQRVRGPVLSRSDWPRSAGWPAELRVHHRSGGACCLAWHGRWGWGLFSAPKNRAYRTTV
jgi:hypothetical protein